MKAVFRADSSTQMGTGHVMRCLTLAQGLLDAGSEVCFVCRDLKGNISEEIEKKGINVYRISGNVGIPVETDWLVVDDYSTDKDWESQMRQAAKKILVIDDLADRQHDCDVLLDQNYYKDAEKRYDNLVPAGCKKYLGPKYALLRKEFLAAERSKREHGKDVSRIMISFGGADPENETAKALEAVKGLKRDDLAIDIVTGGSNPNKDKIEKLCSNMHNATLYHQINNISRIIASADIAIGSGGASTWERCFLGLPTITMVLAQNQAKTAWDLDESGIIVNLGWHKDVSADDLTRSLKDLMSDPKKRQDMRDKGMRLVDGKGVERMIAAVGGN